MQLKSETDVGVPSPIDAITGAAPMVKTQPKVQTPTQAVLPPTPQVPTVNNSAPQAQFQKTDDEWHGQPQAQPQPQIAQPQLPKPVAGPSTESVIKTLLTLLQGGLGVGQAYFHGGGNAPETPNYVQAQRQREQESKIQSANIKNQQAMQNTDIAARLQMQSLEFKQARDIEEVKNRYAVMLNQAQGETQKQIIMATLDAEIAKIREGYKQAFDQLQKVMKLSGGGGPAQSLNSGAMTTRDVASLLGDVKQ